MDNEVTSKLNTLGLSETEAKLYQVGLAHIHSTGVIQLQKQTGLKRPTIYHALDTLMTKGLVAKVAAANRQLYSFTPPSQLERLMEAEILQAQRKLKLAVQLVPTLENLQIESGGTIVSHYEGTEGVKAVIDIALFCKVPKWDILSPKKNFFSEFDNRYSIYYLNTRRRHKITSRSLWEKVEGGRPLTKTEIIERQPRYLPKVMLGKFASTVIIFDDKVAIISSLKSLSAVLITSTELHDFFKAIFEGLWSISTPYKEAN